MLKIHAIQHNYLQQQHFVIYCKLILLTIISIKFFELKRYKNFTRNFIWSWKYFTFNASSSWWRYRSMGCQSWTSRDVSVKSIIQCSLICSFDPFSKDVRLPVSMQRSMAAEAEGQFSYIIYTVCLSNTNVLIYIRVQILYKGLKDYVSDSGNLFSYNSELYLETSNFFLKYYSSLRRMIRVEDNSFFSRLLQEIREEQKRNESSINQSLYWIKKSW